MIFNIGYLLLSYLIFSLGFLVLILNEYFSCQAIIIRCCPLRLVIILLVFTCLGKIFIAI
jgi:hypothetical protein